MTTPEAVSKALDRADPDAVLQTTKALLAVTTDVAAATALDSLMSAYINEAFKRNRNVNCGRAMQELGKMMADGTLPQSGVIMRLPKAKAEPAPPAAVPIAPPARVQRSEEVDGIQAVMDALDATIKGCSTKVSLSALLSVYLIVAERAGDSIGAAEHLVTTGGQVLLADMMQKQALGDAGGQLPPSTSLH